jgi:hypothetical protein
VLQTDQAFTEAVMIRAASAIAKSLKRKRAQGDRAAVFLLVIFFRLWLTESKSGVLSCQQA